METREPLVSIVILNWNRPLDTVACLESLATITYENRHLIVVDNGSTDGSPEQILAAVSGVELLVNSRNLGFAGGANVGIARSMELGAEYVLLLNNDTVVAPDFLEPLVAVCKGAPCVGIAGPKVYYYGTRQVFSNGGWPRRALPLVVRLAAPLGREDPEDVEHEPSQEVDYIWGQAMLIRREVLERIGMFDPAFFMYYEDCDLCLRAVRAGFHVVYVPQARVWHRVALSTHGDELARWRYKVASMAYFHRKHSRLGLLQATLQTLLTLLWIGGRELRRGNWKPAVRMVSSLGQNVFGRFFPAR